MGFRAMHSALELGVRDVERGLRAFGSVALEALVLAGLEAL